MLLITGASGFVGQHLLKDLASSANEIDAVEREILPAWRSHPITNGVHLDLNDIAAVRSIFESHRITAVVHLAAEARTALCQKNPSLAQSGNVEATRNLLAACSAPLPYFLYVSTDMVFRGDQAPYSEADQTDAIAAYGKSKAETEKLVQNYQGAWAIVRPALIYGAPEGGRISSLDTTLNILRTGQGEFFTDEFRTPVYVNDLVRLLGNMLAHRLTGIFNAGGPERMSRYQYAQLVAQTWSMDPNSVKCGEIGNSPEHAWRPKDISLVSTRAHTAIKFTPMEDALVKCRKQMAFTESKKGCL